MIIQYHGDACVRLSGKTSAGEFTVLCDPYDAKATGLKVIRPSLVDIVTTTIGNLPEFEAGPLCITGPGEYEAGGAMVTGIATGKTTVFRIEAEGLSIAHLGNIAQPLTAEVIEQLGDVDVILVPIGGHGVLTTKQAVEIIEQVEPRVVIPIQYRIASAQLPYEGLEAFCKEMGCPPKADEDKFRVTKKDLPEDEVTVKVIAVS